MGNLINSYTNIENLYNFYTNFYIILWLNTDKFPQEYYFMELKFKDYYDKVYGCYSGKTIGGTLGAPFECHRGVFNVDYYVQDTSRPVPNDDIDLQLVWLRAVELERGRIDSHVLAEYWATYISASLCEYGIGKNNAGMNILPPLSGHLHNVNRDSNGAWIRTEIWACLCPGNPALAAMYAYYDACVDHSGEGVYSAVFMAAMQSAAFIESDILKLIDIGLSYIPKDCGVAKAVHCVMESHRSGADFKQARKALLNAVPGGFGMLSGYWTGNTHDNQLPLSDKYPPQQPESDVPRGTHGYDAPSNIGIIIIGLLYSDGDFGKAVCTAVNCGEDTDCTAATVGALLGIIYGQNALPKKWVDGCSGEISVCCLRMDGKLNLPKTVKALADRVARQAPVMLGAHKCDVTAADGFTVIPQQDLYSGAPGEPDLSVFLSEQPHAVRHHFLLHDVIVRYDGSFVTAEEGSEKTLEFTFINNLYDPQYITVRFLGLPEGWQIAGGAEKAVSLENPHGTSIGRAYAKLAVRITPGALDRAKYTVAAEISVNGRPTKSYIPLTFINGV